MTTGAAIAELIADHNAEVDEWVTDNAPRYVEFRDMYARDGIHRDDVSPGFWSWVMYTAGGILGADAAEIPGLDDLGQIPRLERGMQWADTAALTLGVAHMLALADSGLLLKLIELAEAHGRNVIAATKGLTRDEARKASPIGKARFDAAAAKRKAARNG